MLRPRRHSVVIAIALMAVVVVGGFLSLSVATLGVMYSDPCDAGDHALVCSSKGQLLLSFLPLAGWGVAVVLGGVGVVRWVRRGRGGWRPMAIGVGVLGATVAVALWIAEH